LTKEEEIELEIKKKAIHYKNIFNEPDSIDEKDAEAH